MTPLLPSQVLPRGRRRRAAALVLVAALPWAVASCGGDDTGASPSAATSTAPNGDVVSAADVAFATEMIPHHAQALVMVDLSRGRDLDPEVRTVMDDIAAGQGPEIETMSDWLTSWDQPVPQTSRDHAHAEGATSSPEMTGMPGMLDDAQLDELRTAGDGQFQALLLELMIGHHEGAITMAESEVEDGAYAPAQRLAQRIIDVQEREIATMSAAQGG